jgi:hypothetical protein
MSRMPTLAMIRIRFSPKELLSDSWRAAVSAKSCCPSVENRFVVSRSAVSDEYDSMVPTIRDEFPKSAFCVSKLLGIGSWVTNQRGEFPVTNRFLLYC